MTWADDITLDLTKLERDIARLETAEAVSPEADQRRRETLKVAHRQRAELLELAPLAEDEEAA